MVFHATDMRLYLECRRKFKYAIMERLKSTNYSTPEYFDFGTTVHKVLAHHYKGENINWDEIIEDNENRETIPMFYKLYTRQWEMRDSGLDPISIENTIQFDFKGQKFEFTMDWFGIDRNRKPNPVRVIMDHKTYKSFPNPTVLDFDFQASFYLWAASKLEMGVEELIFNVIRKSVPKPPEMLKNGKLSTSQTTLNNTEYWLYQWAVDSIDCDPDEYKDQLEFLKERGSNTFKRFKVKRTPEEIKSFEEMLSFLMDEIGSETFYPIPSLNCGSCPYSTLCKCENAQGNVDFMKQALFVKKNDDER